MPAPDSVEVLTSLRPYAEGVAAATLESAIVVGGNMVDAAQRRGEPYATVRARIWRLKKRAARAGWMPDGGGVQAHVPPGHSLVGLSTLVDGEGNAKGRWVKTKRDRNTDRQEALVDAVRDAVGAATCPLVPFDPKLATRRSKDLLTVYPMGDPHLGMHAWAPEAGENFDLDIAVRDLYEATDRLCSLAPPSREALVVNLGDFFHADNLDAKTRRNGHALDVDTRWPKVLDAGVGVMIRVVRRALERHDRVKVVCAIGNHDDHTSVMLSVALRMFFAHEERVEVAPTVAAHQYHRFGACLIGVHHGDRTKASQLESVMAADRPREWGETRHRYWYTGHVHHDSKKEYRGCSVETFRTLAAKDAWHAAEGYRSGRDMKCIVLHREHGEVLRHTVGISVLSGRR